MLGKLKEKAGDKMIHKVVEQVAPSLKPHLDRIQELDPQRINDDEFWNAEVVTPALTAVKLGTSGVAGMIPGFDERFARALFNVRNELLIVGDDKVALADDFAERLPTVLLDGFRQTA